MSRRASQPSATPGADPVIRSTSNQIVRYVRSLQRRSTRRLERAFVVEGVRAVADALAAGAAPTLVVVREGDEAHVPGTLDQLRIVASDVFAGIADTVHPQGLLAVFPIPTLAVTDKLPAFYLVCDRVGDPGNFGTLLRSAAAAGVTQVVILPETVDPYAPKVVRSAMGAHFRVPIAEWSPEVERALISACPQRILADLGPYPVYDQVDLGGPLAVIVASETAGPSDCATDLATTRATIPMDGGVESLNAAMAGTVLLFEVARQRRTGTRTLCLS